MFSHETSSEYSTLVNNSLLQSKVSDDQKLFVSSSISYVHFVKKSEINCKDVMWTTWISMN